MFKNRINAFRKLGAATVGAVAVGAGTSAHAAGTAFDTITASVDFSTVATWVGVIGVAILGICMAFKAIDLGKRGVKKA
ncbi:hypothetical protein ACEPMY_01260 [Ralstonia pseudosolanacearum]|uniref:hypothetical protein n=1 Tax=Ralstonia pseudosolanacearum TaxID=1310165 RepID=UPI003870312B